MSHLLPTIELFLLAWLVFLAMGGAVSVLVARGLGPRLGQWEPRSRHRALLMLAGLPVLIAVSLMLSATLPSILSLELGGFDHCADHTGHPHLCFVHLPHVGTNMIVVAGLIVVAAYSLFRTVRMMARVARASRVVSVLCRSGERCADLDVTIIETSQPLCLAAGLLRPRVLLSRGLLNSLSANERAIVIAHERAHVRRRDALTAWFVRVLMVAHWPALRRWLVQEIDVAAEQSCDEEAGEIVGDRIAVASTILAVHRVGRQGVAAKLLVPIAIGFGGAEAAQRRVEALLAAPPGERSLTALAAVFSLVAASLLVASSQLHHMVESLLSLVAY